MKRFALIPALLVLLLTLPARSQDSKNPAGTDITFVSIPGGTFEMGDVEHSGESNETPVHSVALNGFEMSVYEITNEQYAAYLNAAKVSEAITATSSSATGASGEYGNREFIYLSGQYPSYPYARCWITYSNDMFNVVSGYENWPVVWVTWYGAKAFAFYYGLDLPTESEWEYASRGGRQYKYGTDDGTLSMGKANYWGNNIQHPVPVGSYPANPCGLYDMSGNVWEWCHDYYGTYPRGSVKSPTGAQNGSFRVMRGSSWSSGDFGGYGVVADYCRSADRSFYSPADGYYYIGFRVVRRAGGLEY